MATTENDTMLTDYGAILRRHWLLLVGGMLIGSLLGAGAILAVPATYTSTTSVIVLPTADDTNVVNGRTTAEINLDTEAQIVTSSMVASQVASQLHSASAPSALAEQVTVTVPPNTSVLNIAFTASSAQGALDGARAFADAYLANRKSLAEDHIRDQTASLDKKITSLNAQLKKVTEELAAAAGSNQIYLSTQKDLLVQQIRANTAKLSPLSTQSVRPGSIITAAQLPTSPTGLSRSLALASGLFAGLLLGLIAAVLRDRSDHRIYGRRDLERLGLDVLVDKFELTHPSRIVQPGRPSDEPLRRFRNALLTALIDQKGSVLIASASSTVAGARAAANLASTMASSGVKTALVSANTEYNIIGDAFGVPESPGLTDVLRSGIPESEALHPVTDMPGLSVVPRGADSALFAESLQDSSIRPVLAEFESRAEVVILDVAPTSINADAQTVVSATRGLVLVTTAALTTTDDIVEAVDQMTHVNAPLLGAVIVTLGKSDKVGPKYAMTSSQIERDPKTKRPDRPKDDVLAATSAGGVKATLCTDPEKLNLPGTK